MQGRAPLVGQVKAIARCAPGEPGGQRRRPTLEIGARAAHSVRIDDHTGVAVSDVLAAHRRHDGLVVDAGIGHENAERLEGGDGAALEVQHPRRVLRRQQAGLRYSD